MPVLSELDLTVDLHTPRLINSISNTQLRWFDTMQGSETGFWQPSPVCLKADWKLGKATYWLVAFRAVSLTFSLNIALMLWNQMGQMRVRAVVDPHTSASSNIWLATILMRLTHTRVSWISHNERYSSDMFYYVFGVGMCGPNIKLCCVIFTTDYFLCLWTVLLSHIFVHRTYYVQ